MATTYMAYGLDRDAQSAAKPTKDDFADPPSLVDRDDVSWRREKTRAHRRWIALAAARGLLMAFALVYTFGSSGNSGIGVFGLRRRARLKAMACGRLARTVTIRKSLEYRYFR